MTARRGGAAAAPRRPSARTGAGVEDEVSGRQGGAGPDARVAAVCMCREGAGGAWRNERGLHTHARPQREKGKLRHDVGAGAESIDDAPHTVGDTSARLLGLVSARSLSLPSPPCFERPP